MRRILIGLIILLLAGIVYADTHESITDYGSTILDTFTISANTTSDVALPAYYKGRYLVQAYIEATADDSIVITIKKSDSGPTIGSLTTTSATSGEYILLSFSNGAEDRFITETPYYSLSGMSSGSATLELVSVK